MVKPNASISIVIICRDIHISIIFSNAINLFEKCDTLTMIWAVSTTPDEDPHAGEVQKQVSFRP